MMLMITCSIAVQQIFEDSSQWLERCCGSSFMNSDNQPITTCLSPTSTMSRSICDLCIFRFGARQFPTESARKTHEPQVPDPFSRAQQQDPRPENHSKRV